MSNEIRVQCSLQIVNSNLNYSRAKGFAADQNATAGSPSGPAPSQIQATTTGVIVSFSDLTSGKPGWAWFENNGPTYDALIGVYNPVLADFYPLFRLKPGKAFPAPLYEFLGEAEGTTGTATVTSGFSLMVKGVGGTAQVLIDAFDY